MSLRVCTWNFLLFTLLKLFSVVALLNWAALFELADVDVAVAAVGAGLLDVGVSAADDMDVNGMAIGAAVSSPSDTSLFDAWLADEAEFVERSVATSGSGLFFEKSS